MWLGCHKKKNNLEAVTLQVWVATSTRCDGKKSSYGEAKRYQSPGGARQDARGPVKSWTQAEQVTPISSLFFRIWALYPYPTLCLNTQPSQCCSPSWLAHRRFRPPTASGLSRARQNTDQRPQIHLCTVQQLPSITHSECSLFRPFLGLCRSKQTVPPPAGKTPPGKPNIKPRQTPSLQRDTGHQATSPL